MRSMSKLEIDSVTTTFTLNTSTLVSRIILQNQLLEEEIGSLVINFLSYLYLRLPEMRCVNSFAVVTLQVLDLKLGHKGLLDLCIGHDLFLNSQFDL